MPEPDGHLEYISLGLNLAVGMGICVFIGYHIDQKFSGGQTWTLVGVGLGLFYGGYQIWKILRQVNKS